MSKAQSLGHYVESDCLQDDSSGKDLRLVRLHFSFTEDREDPGSHNEVPPITTHNKPHNATPAPSGMEFDDDGDPIM